MPTPDERNIERRVLTVTSVQQLHAHSAEVRVTAAGQIATDSNIGTEVTFVTKAKDAPRVGVQLNATFEAVR